MKPRDFVSRLSLREKCAQMIVVPFSFDEPDYDRVMDWVKKDGVGGVHVSGGTLFDVAPLVNTIQKVSRIPLLVSADYDNGVGEQVSGGTVFPSNLALGAAGSEDLACLKGWHTAIEARAGGVRWVTTPVAEAGTETRMFGEDPALVGRMCRGFLRRYKEAGMLGCLKHPPDRVEEGAGSVRIAHRPADGEPASLSARHVTGIFREKLGYDGIVSTDALDLPAVTGFCAPAEAVQRAACAGVDVLFRPPDASRALAALEAMVQGGSIPEAGVDRAVERLIEAKVKLELFRNKMTDQFLVDRVLGVPARAAAAQEVADAAVTLVRGPGKVPGRVAYVGGPGVFETELRKRVTIDEAAEACVAGHVSSDEASDERVREACRRYRDVCVVSFGSPLALRGFPEVSGYVCAYGADEFVQRAAARALAGELEFKGTLPLRLDV